MPGDTRLARSTPLPWAGPLAGGHNPLPSLPRVRYNPHSLSASQRPGGAWQSAHRGGGLRTPRAGAARAAHPAAGAVGPVGKRARLLARAAQPPPRYARDRWCMARVGDR